jgi:ubiquinone/menaquinone biosynthesis C-methylase UbiE
VSIYKYISVIYPLVDLWAMPSKTELTTQIQALKTGRLLDIGCGTAAIWPQWAQHDRWGIDNSSHMLQCSLSGEIKERLLHADAHKLPFDEAQFDIAVLSHVLSTVTDVSAVMSEVHRVLKPDGICLIQNHDSKGWKYFDRLIQPVAYCLGVRVPFHILSHIDESLWQIEKERKIGRFSYFKVITLRKR